MKLPILIIILILTGCKEPNRLEKLSGGRYQQFYCIEGVSYLEYGSGFTVMLDTNSKVIKCEEGM